MEKITKIPGLLHISKDIFQLLDKDSLLNCRRVNSSWKEFLDQPIFWSKKLKSENIPQDIQTRSKLAGNQLLKNMMGMQN